MKDSDILTICQRRGWLVVVGTWYKIVPRCMLYPQGVSAPTLAGAFKITTEWFDE